MVSGILILSLVKVMAISLRHHLGAKAWVILIAISFLLALPSLSFAAEKSVKDNLRSALKGGGVVNFSGKENDDVKIPKGATVIGKSPADAVINGQVTMENGSVLRNVTVNGDVFGIIVEKGASATLENVTVKGASDTGIFTKQGSGTLIVRNSRIIQNRKGFYILPGKTLLITGSEVARNKEEGIDVRWEVGGTISGNRIAQNGEGGAEIIVGSSSLTVTGNSFTGNKSSGLSLQFYSDAKKLGKMVMERNAFAANGNHGITCGSPNSSGLPASYFTNSVRLRENVFSAGNKRGNINPACRLANIFPKTEADEDEEAAVPEPVIDPEVFRAKERMVEDLSVAVAALRGEIEIPRGYIRKLRHRLFRSDDWHFATHRENIRRLEERLMLLSSSDQGAPSAEAAVGLSGKIVTLQDELRALAEQIERQNQEI